MWSRAFGVAEGQRSFSVSISPHRGVRLVLVGEIRESEMIAGGWIWFLPLPWDWRIALSQAVPCELGGTQCHF